MFSPLLNFPPPLLAALWSVAIIPPPPYKIWTPESPKILDGPNRQSLVFNERGQLSHAIPQFHVERILHQWTPIARFKVQRNERRAYEDQILSFDVRYELQWTLAIWIAATTLASDSAITIARFRPSKPKIHPEIHPKSQIYLGIANGAVQGRGFPQ